MLLLLRAWARCDGFPVAASIGGMLGCRNQVVYVLSVLPGSARRLFRGGGSKAIEPRLDRLRFKADEAMNATARNLVFGNPEVECGFFDVEPS